MTKNSMGQFLSALRKANGMTQQAVAERLSVSNKAVSRWERDECAPDISLLPALAEMYGVTCDELLKGERIADTADAGKSERRIEAQVKALINHSISRFQSMMWISVVLAVLGLVSMFAITYGISVTGVSSCVIGFAVMLLFEAVSFVISAIAVNKMKEAKGDNELFETVDNSLTEKFYRCLGSLSFVAFFLIFSSIVLSVSLLVMFGRDYSYLVVCLGIILILEYIFLMGKSLYITWITEQPRSRNFVKVQWMNLLQLGMAVIAGILFMVGTFQAETPPKTGFVIAGFVLLCGAIICFAVFYTKFKERRKQLLLPGIRNILLSLSILLLLGVHRIKTAYSGELSASGIGILGQAPAGAATAVSCEEWDGRVLLLGIGLAFLIPVFFKIIDAVVKKKRQKHQCNNGPGE